jgi:hypothetical protein
VYDDKIVFTYNYKDGSQTLTLQEIESALCSDLTSFSPPKKTVTLWVAVFFWFWPIRTRTHLNATARWAVAAEGLTEANIYFLPKQKMQIKSCRPYQIGNHR